MANVSAIIPKEFTPTVYAALETQDNVIFFQWDLTADTFKLRKNTCRHRYDLPARFTRASTRLALDGIVHPDDASMLEYYFHSIFHNHSAERRHQLSARLRLRGRKRPQWLWSEIRLITYYNDKHIPVVAFGNIRNIQAERLWQERTNRRASIDELTGLLCKGTAQKQICTALRQLSPKKDSATLLIVDADDFKSINDTFGHLFGDAVLREMGRAIRSNFRQTDIKGRIGGDEFIVMLPGMDSPEVTARHCASLCRCLSRVFNAGNKTHAFSISVGAAQFPQHGHNYRELFNHADQALYEAKRRGKGQYVLYDHDMPISSELIGRQDDTAVAVSPVPAVRDTEQSETIAELQARIREMESTISCMEKLLNTLLVKQ